MALPVLDKTWQHDTNNQVLSDGTQTGGATDGTNDKKQLLYEIKEFLIGVGSGAWSVVASAGGNGTGFVGGTPVADASDNWLQPSDLRWNTTSNDRAWIVLRQTDWFGVGDHLEVCIDCVNQSNEDGTRLDVLISRAGFSGFTALDARPTATDEVFILNFSAWANGINESSGRDWRWHGMVSTDGEATRVIIHHNNNPLAWFVVQKPKNPVTGWSNIVVAEWGSTGSSSGEITSFGNYHDSANMHTMETSGLANGDALYLTSEGFGTNAAGEQFIQQNQVDGNFGFFPMGLASLQPGFIGRHGELADLWWGNSNANEGDTFPTGGSRQFVQFGDMIFPWDGSAPILA